MDLNIKEHSAIAPISINRVDDVQIEKVHDIQATHIHDIQVTHVKDVEIEKIQKIAPVATHIKEINNIDPLTVDTFNVSEIRNVEPLKVEKFDITTLPPVNVTLRQLPPVDMNIRKVPPLSVGLHQHFHIPSRYHVSGSVLGFELFRITLSGETTIVPRSGVHREVANNHAKSIGDTAAAGNPAIPFKHVAAFEKSSGWDTRQHINLSQNTKSKE